MSALSSPREKQPVPPLQFKPLPPPRPARRSSVSSPLVKETLKDTPPSTPSPGRKESHISKSSVITPRTTPRSPGAKLSSRSPVPLRPPLNFSVPSSSSDDDSSSDIASPTGHSIEGLANDINQFTSRGGLLESPTSKASLRNSLRSFGETIVQRLVPEVEIALTIPCYEHVISYFFDPDLKPKQMEKMEVNSIWNDLRPYFKVQLSRELPEKCPTSIKTLIERVAESHLLMTTGILIENSLSYDGNDDQLLRGIRQYDHIKINEEIIHPVTLDYNETNLTSILWSPPCIRDYYLSMIDIIREHRHLDEAFLLQLFKGMNIGTWGIGNNIVRGKIPEIFDSPYHTVHHRICNVPNFGEPDATLCEIDISHRETNITQIRKFQTGLKATGLQVNDTPIAHFTLILTITTKENDPLRLSLKDFAWAPNLSPESKKAFMYAFLGFKPYGGETV